MVTIDDLIADPALTVEERRQYRAWKRHCAKEWGEGSPAYASQAWRATSRTPLERLVPLRVDRRGDAAGVHGVRPGARGARRGRLSRWRSKRARDRRGAGPARAVRVQADRRVARPRHQATVGKALNLVRECSAALRVDVIGIGKGVADAIRASIR